MEFFCNENTLPPGLPEEDVKRFLKETSSVYTPEDRMELAFILSGKCYAGGYIFPAPALGTYLLLEEWKSPFLPDEKGKKRKICMQDLFLALYILENGKKASLELLKRRYEEFYYGRKKEMKKSFPYRELAELRKKYSRLDPERAAKDLTWIFSLHGALDMLPDGKVPSGSTGEVLCTGEEKIYMEKICDLLFFSRSILPGFSFDEVLWKIPYVLLGYLFVRESRKAGLEGIGRIRTSERLWELFSRHLGNTVKNKEKKNAERA